MSLWVILIVGFATFVNLFAVKYKIEHRRFGDALLDGGALVALSLLFGHTAHGMAVAMVASMCVSIALLFYPPRMHRSP